jgi:putative nucleotidyltransferase with HDIG domain
MDDAKVIAAKVGDLPPLPHVATRVIELMGNPNTNASDLEQIISRDLALTTRVLKLANSALFGRRGMVSTLSRAIVLLGFKTVHSLVIAASTESIYSSSSTRFKEMLLWEHAVAAALAAGYLARECRYRGVEEAFLGGLLHDIGKVVLDTNLGERYQGIVERVYNEGVTFIDAEEEMLGFDHAEVGSLVIRKWNLPDTLEEAVRLHHRAMRSLVDPILCAIVSLANSACVKIGIGPERLPELDLTRLDVTARLKILPDRLTQLLQTIESKLVEEKELFNIT